MNLLITGINGFVGNELAKAAQKRGITVKGTVRSVCENSLLVEDGVQIFSIGEIHEQTTWERALNGVDVVVHLAARVHIMNDLSDDSLTLFRRVNTAGTEQLARQSAEAGVKRFVYLSSIKVNGESTRLCIDGLECNEQKRGKYFSESDLANPSDPYAISKWEAEKSLFQISANTGMEVVIVRPPLVYGPGVKANFYKIMHCLAKGIPLPLGAIYNKRSLVALDNLVDLIVTCIEHPAAANQIFLAGDGDDLSTTELLKVLCTMLGKPARLLPVSQRLLEFGLKMVGKSDVCQRLCGSLQVDISKARELLGWNPPLSVAEGLKKTAEWYLRKNNAE